MVSMSEHVVAYKYMVEFFKVNLNFKNNFTKSFFFEKTHSLKMLINGFFVSPIPINVYIILSLVKTGKEITTCSPRKLEDYISLTRANFSPLVKSWCDWCSIANGYCTFLITAINEYYDCQKLDSMPVKKLRKIKNLFNCTGHIKILMEKNDFFSDKKPTGALDLFPDIYGKSPPALQILLDKLAQKYNEFQAVEQQWCPFKHMKKIASLAHTDKDRYDYYLRCEGYQDIIKTGELIYNFKHLKCHQCVDVINSFLEYDSGSQNNKLHLQTEDFVDLICKLSR